MSNEFDEFDVAANAVEEVPRKNVRKPQARMNGYGRTLSMCKDQVRERVVNGTPEFKRRCAEAALKFLLASGGQYLEAAVLHAMPYAEYLQTAHWEMRAGEAKKRAGYKCAVCNSDGELHAHHRTYERRGFEADEDLTVLCANCHAMYHDKLPKPE